MVYQKRFLCRILCLFLIGFVESPIMAKAPDYTINPGKSGSGWSQESSRYKINNKEYQKFWLDVPEISFTFKRANYSIGGASARVTAKWDVFQKDDGSEDYGTIAAYSRNFLKEGYQLKLNNFIKPKIMRLLAEVNVPVTVRHEVVHFLVDQKYGSILDTMPYTDRHFIQEMMAHMGEGLSEDEALTRVTGNYPKLASAVREFKTERETRRLRTAKKILAEKCPSVTGHSVTQQQTPVGGNVHQPSITMDDVLNALREDGSGEKKVSEALR